MNISEYLYKKEQDLITDKYYVKREQLRKDLSDINKKLLSVHNDQTIYPSTDFSLQINELEQKREKVEKALEAFLLSEIEVVAPKQISDTISTLFLTVDLVKCKEAKIKNVVKFLQKSGYSIVNHQVQGTIANIVVTVSSTAIPLPDMFEIAQRNPEDDSTDK